MALFFLDKYRRFAAPNERGLIPGYQPPDVPGVHSFVPQGAADDFARRPALAVNIANGVVVYQLRERYHQVGANLFKLSEQVVRKFRAVKSQPEFVQVPQLCARDMSEYPR